jgi:hypothetical protein
MIMKDKKFRKDMTPEEYLAYLAHAETPDNYRQQERAEIPWNIRYKSKKKVG